MSFSRASSSTLRSASPSSSRHFTTTTLRSLEPKNYNPWQGKSHLKPLPKLPNPLPRIYPQKVVLSDGSTFTAYTTAPTPAIIRLTRDVTNNPLWAPGTDSAGLGDDDEGQVGRFRKRFEGMGFTSARPRESAEEAVDEQGGLGPDDGVVADDLSWMEEGGREEKAPPPKLKKAPAGKGGKKK